MALEHRDGHASEWVALQSVATKLGCTAETPRGWLRQAGIQAGDQGSRRASVSS